MFVKLISSFLLFFSLYNIILHRSYDVSVLSLRICHLIFLKFNICLLNNCFVLSLLLNLFSGSPMTETNQLKGFVELRDSSDAANVISVLNGANIYDDCCTLEVRLHHFCPDFLCCTTYSNLLNSS